MESKGIAPLVVMIIVVAAGGASIGAPVAVDTIDVDPDSPFYALERLGERIKGVGDMSLMQERFMEFSKMCDKGKGSSYLSIQDEFQRLYDKLMTKLPENSPKRAKILEWIQKQRARFVKNRIQLLKEAALRMKLDLRGTTDEARVAEIEEQLSQALEKLRARPRVQVPPELDNVLLEVAGQLELLKQKISELKARVETKLSLKVRKSIEAEESATEVEFEVEARAGKPSEEEYQELLEEYEKLQAELQKVDLQIAPPLAGTQAVQALIQVAAEHYRRAQQAYENGRLGGAVGQLRAAVVCLKRAEKIFEHAEEWEEEHAKEWRFFKRCKVEIEQRLAGELGVPASEIYLHIENLRIGKIREAIGKSIKEVSEEELESRYENLFTKVSTECSLLAQECEENYAQMEQQMESLVYQWRQRRIGSDILQRSLNKLWIGFVPQIIRVSGTVTGTLNLSFDHQSEKKIADIFKIETKTSGMITGTVENGAVSATLGATGSRDLENPHFSDHAEFTVNAQITGTLEPVSYIENKVFFYLENFAPAYILKCKITGEGSGTGEHRVMAPWGTVSWTYKMNFAVAGKLVGKVDEDGNFEGVLYLRISSASASVQLQATAGLPGETGGGENYPTGGLENVLENLPL